MQGPEQAPPPRATCPVPAHTPITTADKKEPFANAETSLEGLSVFRVTLHQADGDKLDMFLRRDGLSWKLYRIDLPLDEIGKPTP